MWIFTIETYADSYHICMLQALNLFYKYCTNANLQIYMQREIQEYNRLAQKQKQNKNKSMKPLIL